MTFKKRVIRFFYSIVLFFETKFDKNYLHKDVKEPKLVPHSRWREHLYQIANKEGFRILEIGSREVTGLSEDRKRFNKAEYVGFDYYPGDNVDIVGDAHQISTYFDFDKEEKFDLVYTSASFEHFAMPWLVAEEIQKVLKVGGYVFVETHFSYSTHQRPWNFFQFSDWGLKVLFNQALGFECIEAGMSNPMVGRFSSYADKHLRNYRIKGLYCHSEFLGKKVKDVANFRWQDTNLDQVVQNTKYPEPQKDGIF